MASLTPRMQVERLAIGDDPLVIAGCRIVRIDNRLYEVNDTPVGNNRLGMDRLIALVCEQAGFGAPVPPLVRKPQPRRRNRARTCVVCGDRCGYRSERCRPCAQRQRRRIAAEVEGN